MNKSVLLLTTLLSGLAASTAGASIVVSASPTDVGGGLTQYLLNFASTGAGAKPIAAFDIEFAAATMSQQNAGGALDTTFQNNNAVIPALGGSVAKDTQFLFNTLVQVGVDNVTDKQPPIFFQQNVINANTDVNTYDTAGRFYWAKVTVKF